MTPLKRWRFIYWILKDLAQKYTRAITLGFIIGFAASLTFWRLGPYLYKNYFTPVNRIGVVGQFTPYNLPLFIQSQISFGLTRTDPDGQIKPALAESWEVTESGKIYNFYLKDNLKWHSGKSVIAGDVNYNIKDVSFNTINDRFIQARLNSPYSPFPSLVSKPLFQGGLTGLGEKKVSRLKLNGEYVESMRLIPVIPESKQNVLEYRFYGTEAQAILAFKLGEIDEIVELTNPGDLALMKNVVIENNIRFNRIVALFFNNQNDFLSEKKHRQGLGFALPKVSGIRAISPISKHSWAFNEDVKIYNPDPVQAKKLLFDGDIDATQSAGLNLITFPQYLDLASDVAASWSGIGIKTNVKVENSVPGDYQVLLTAIDLPPDPDQYSFWHSTQTTSNITSYVNVRIDKLLEDARRESNQDKRTEIYAEFQRRLVDDAPAIFLYYPEYYNVKRR